MTAFLVLGAIGMVLAILLILASKYLYVEEDKRVETVASLLPGYNCGACGFAGCSGFAEAIVEEKESNLTMCKPGKLETNYNPIVEFFMEQNPEFAKKIKVK